MVRIVKYSLIFLSTCILIFVIYSLSIDVEKVKTNDILEKTDELYAVINKYFIYGRSLNIEGYIDNYEIPNKVSLVLKGFNKEEKEYNLKYEINENKIYFRISDEINNGINLDAMDNGNYYILVKVVYNNEKIKYYSINNKTEYKNNEYYTMTKYNKNNKVLINFGESNLKDKIKKYMMIKVKEVKLPENIYDIVIDPGHGGKDSGALSLDGSYYESNITLDYGKDLKESLEKLGLKVKLTRNGENEEKLGIYDSYGKNGRAIVPNSVKDKYTFSIHLNSSPYKITNGGVEVYAPTLSNLNLAKCLADNIVENAHTTYSLSETFKIMNGVYVRYLTDDDIKLSEVDANKNGYEPYDIKANTPYYFMIRETGGIATHAYIDGRNKNYGKNEYCNSNIGVETYLIELGYIVCDKDLNNILNNKESYIDGITNAIKNYFEL